MTSIVCDVYVERTLKFVKSRSPRILLDTLHFVILLNFTYIVRVRPSSVLMNKRGSAGNVQHLSPIFFYVDFVLYQSFRYEYEASERVRVEPLICLWHNMMLSLSISIMAIIRHTPYDAL